MEQPVLITDVCCDSCGKTFTSTDEVFQSTIRYVVGAGTRFEQRHVTDTDGDIRFLPILMHLECWEEVVEELREQIEDQPPTEDADSVLYCTLCGSGVREWEYYARLHIGELHRSLRAPDGEHLWKFTRVDTGNGTLVCIGCMSTIHDDVLEIWEDVSQEGECTDCARVRCWRGEGCECGCHVD